jgi:5-methylcytosine-specific restriction enzyme B
MNPEDRSVDEIDAAMERRWAKVKIRPDATKVREFLEANGMVASVYGPIVEFFNALQSHIELGHAFFRTVRSVESLQRLWGTQLEFAIQKRFRFDAESLKAVTELWKNCLAAAIAASTAIETPATEPIPGPEQQP